MSRPASRRGDLDRIHPELRRVAPFLPRGPVTARTRPWINRVVAPLARSRPAGVVVEAVGGCSVRVHRPPGMSETSRPAVLWIHGGGYVIGTAAQDDAICRRLARRHGAVVAAVDYRLAPDHPFPVPLEDCHDALVWLADRFEVDRDRVVIAGASAGGGLAAALALLARDRGVVRPALQVLVYPMLDDRTVGRSDVDEGGFRLWGNRSNRYGWASYLGREPGGDGVPALAAPARADERELAGLPPAWLGVGTLDLFRDEDLAYAERLRAVGVGCDVEVVDGAFHGFDTVAPRSPVTRRFLASLDAAVERAVG